VFVVGQNLNLPTTLQQYLDESQYISVNASASSNGQSGFSLSSISFGLIEYTIPLGKDKIS